MAKTEIKNIGIITSGGDAGGLNAVIRGAAQMALAQGIKPYVIPNGYAGLYNLVDTDELVFLDVSASQERRYFRGCLFMPDADSRARSTSSTSVSRCMRKSWLNRRQARFLITKSLNIFHLIEFFILDIKYPGDIAAQNEVSFLWRDFTHMHCQDGRLRKAPGDLGQPERMRALVDIHTDMEG